MLKDLPQFKGQLPATLEIDQNSDSVMVFDQLQNCEITIKEGSETTLVAFLKDGWEDLRKLNFNFEGSASTLTFLAFIIAKNEDNFPFETISTHNVPNTNAFYYIRAAQFDKSKVDYQGMLKMNKPAQQTDSYLAHNTLMLSKNAKTHTVPSLEIEADDVKAGHAATIGRVDEDMLFYLQSRGISAQQAKEMLIQGFMESDLKKIPDETVRAALVTELEAVL